MMEKTVAKIRRDFGGISAGDNKEIQEVARLLLDGIMGENARKYPRLIVKLLQGMGFCLFRTIFKTPAQTGLLAVDPSLEELDPRYERGRVIFVDSRTSTAHQRFVIATLLGHYIFDFDEANEITYYEMYQGKEADEAGMRANRFALELLMPANDFVRKCNELEREQGEVFSMPATITRLSKYFDSPVAAVRKRLEQTGKFQGRGGAVVVANNIDKRGNFG